MPHQCVRCSTFYEDGATEIIEGCSCGAKLFFYVKKEKVQQAEEVARQIAETLDETEKKKMEEDIFDMISDNVEDDTPVVLDFESIRVLKPGKFELDLSHLFNKEKPVVFKLGEGKYIIDLPETFMRVKEAKKGKEEKEKK
ncbi:hypothetical protein HYS47_01790 [Candidatus Woesearchaeota archaeon]|nr:hypothetical protein [Candidatus Woesearchaeota archaeon]